MSNLNPAGLSPVRVSGRRSNRGSEHPIEVLLLSDIGLIIAAATIFATAKSIDHVIQFYREGADYIMHLKLLGGKKISEHLEYTIKKGQDYILNRKLDEIKSLEKKRKFELMERMDPVVLRQLEELKCDIGGDGEKSK